MIYSKKESLVKKYMLLLKKDNKFVVLKNPEGKTCKYSIAGGGVEEGEDNISAIKREVFEELNMKVEIVESIGIVGWKQKWKYENKEFEVQYNAEIFLTKFVDYANNKNLGLEGEFIDKNKVSVDEISKEELLEGVYEFKHFGLKF